MEMMMQKARSSNISGQEVDDDESKSDFEDSVLGMIHLELARYHEGAYLTYRPWLKAGPRFGDFFAAHLFYLTLPAAFSQPGMRL